MSEQQANTARQGIDRVDLRRLREPLQTSLDAAEAALIDFSRDIQRREPLLHCLWSVHHITAALGALRLHKAEMLALEMERGFLRLLRGDVVAERRNLVMGGLMRAIKTLPAYLDHVEQLRLDSGRGLEPCVNDLRRWAGEVLRPPALFFHFTLPVDCGITSNAQRPSEESIRRGADVMLAPYLQGAKGVLGSRPGAESARTLARIAQKMQGFMTGTVQEPFWLLLIALCEALAAELAEPDECIAQIFKAGAFMVKYAREHGSAADPAMDYPAYIQQALYYMAACPVQPLYVAHVWKVFGLTGHTLRDAQRGLIHSDALLAACNAAAARLAGLIDTLEQADMEAVATGRAPHPEEAVAQLQSIRLRLIAAGEELLAEDLRGAGDLLEQLCAGRLAEHPGRCRQAVLTLARTLVDTHLAVSRRVLLHGEQSSVAPSFAVLAPLIFATSARLNQLQEQLQQGDDVELRQTAADDLRSMEQALAHQGMLRAASVAGLLGRWLVAAREPFTTDEPAAMHFAQALAWLSLYFESLGLDPAAAPEQLQNLLDAAEREAGCLQPAPAPEPADAAPSQTTADPAPEERTETIPAAFRDVFLEESQEIIARLQSELPAWVAAPARDDRLREIRRHFHTFKGNGNAVGLFTLGDLGRDVQDLLDRVLEGQHPMDPALPGLLEEVLEALPELVATCGGAGDFDVRRVRDLRNRCMNLGRGGADGR
ncbi:MAG: Hpt domain-containing protein [Halieaceae bacterium]|uniref:Hpt domain-containing protein n=1 Tax=Haliea alexandrii TaxID=2448162 RepID=UPI000F0B5857|nr:Hpt domain-containing protein [Haliea alexandrii]MCR9185401.1 Hpt domain-containing protein [Halieaceae bacterium]